MLIVANILKCPMKWVLAFEVYLFKFVSKHSTVTIVELRHPHIIANEVIISNDYEGN